MKIRLFPQHFLQRDGYFGLFRLEDNGELDLPLTIEADARIPVPIVHSNPHHLAYLVGLIALQAWTTGIDELGTPPAERRSLLVVTDKPGQFAEAYLRLRLPGARIRDVSSRRRVTLYEKTGHAPIDKSGYWDNYVGPDDDRTRCHFQNYPPIFNIMCQLMMISSPRSPGPPVRPRRRPGSPVTRH
jgi:hypothetical protein